jgi:hypothetical protein
MMSSGANADGLSTPAEVEALADQLSACADTLHARLAIEAATIGAMPATGAKSAARARRREQLAAMVDAEHTWPAAAGSAPAHRRGGGKNPQDHVAGRCHRTGRRIGGAGWRCGAEATDRGRGCAEGHPHAGGGSEGWLAAKKIAGIRSLSPRMPPCPPMSLCPLMPYAGRH